MGDQAHFCTCSAPDWVSHANWWRCKNCLGTLPYVPAEDVFDHMRMVIAEGRARVMRRSRID